MQRSPRSDIARLARELAGLLEPAGVSAQELSRELGFHPTYLSRVFRGDSPLKVEVAFSLLAFVGADPTEFFEERFPFGGPVMRLALEQLPLHARRDATLDEVRRVLHHRLAAEEATPAAWAARAGAVLRSLLKRRHTSQRAASLSAGYGPSVLGQAMRGASQLTFEHIFAALDVAKVPAGRFVKELFGPPEATLLGLVRWRKALDHAEGLVPELTERFAERRSGARTR